MKAIPDGKIPCAIAILLFASCCTAVSGPPTTESAIGKDEVRFSAMGMYAKHRSSKHVGTEYVPLSIWTEAVRALDPLYVYVHGLDIVVVLMRDGDTEQGVYLFNPLSSSGGHGLSEAGFTLGEPEDHGGHPFVRESPTTIGVGTDK